MVWFCLVLWPINHCRLLNDTYNFYIYLVNIYDLV